jgi:hypothetical protein
MKKETDSTMEILKRTNRFYYVRPEGFPQIRVYHRKGSEKKMPRYLLKCGCCDEKLEIYYAHDGLEINGVNGSVEDWREILLPLLRIEKKGTKLTAKKQGSG